MIDIQSFMDENRKWTDKTFPESNTITSIKHLKSEVEELKNSFICSETTIEETFEEVADCYLLLLNICSHLNLSFESLHNIAIDKMSVNKKREWVKNDKGFFQHKK